MGEIDDSRREYAVIAVSIPVYCVYTCLLFVYLSTVCIPVYCVYTCLLFVYLSTVCIPVYCLYTCLLCVYLFTVCIPVYCLYTCLLFVYLSTVCIPVYCVYTCLLGVYLSTVCIYRVEILTWQCRINFIVKYIRCFYYAEFDLTIKRYLTLSFIWYILYEVLCVYPMTE